MKDEEAIERLKSIMIASIDASVGANEKPITTALKLAISALHKRVPEKPEKTADGYFDGNEVYDYFCPCCHLNFEDDMPSFCEDCGQAIDWNDE